MSYELSNRKKLFFSRKYALVSVLTIFNDWAHFTFKWVFLQAVSLFKFDCEITIESVPVINQYYAMQVQFLAQGNNESLVNWKKNYFTFRNGDTGVTSVYSTVFYFVTLQTCITKRDTVAYIKDTKRFRCKTVQECIQISQTWTYLPSSDANNIINTCKAKLFCLL